MKVLYLHGWNLPPDECHIYEAVRRLLPHHSHDNKILAPCYHPSDKEGGVRATRITTVIEMLLELIERISTS